MNPDLPPSVEQQLESIRNRHGLPPVRPETRRLLASHGVDAALRLLAKISAAGTVRSLDGYIWKLGGEAGRGGRLSPLGRDRVVEPSHAPKRMSDVVLALSKLDFRKAFMILSYAGRRRIEEVLSVEYIRDVGNLPMVTFEKQVWERIGRECIDPADRRKESDWDDQKTHIYRCFIDEDGEVTFKASIEKNGGKRTIPAMSDKWKHLIGWKKQSFIYVH